MHCSFSPNKKLFKTSKSIKISNDSSEKNKVHTKTVNPLEDMKYDTKFSQLKYLSNQFDLIIGQPEYYKILIDEIKKPLFDYSHTKIYKLNGEKEMFDKNEICFSEVKVKYRDNSCRDVNVNLPCIKFRKSAFY